MGKQGGGSIAFGKTQAFRNIMAYLAGESPTFQFPKGKEDYYKEKYPAFMIFENRAFGDRMGSYSSGISVYIKNYVQTNFILFKSIFK